MAGSPGWRRLQQRYCTDCGEQDRRDDRHAHEVDLHADRRVLADRLVGMLPARRDDRKNSSAGTAAT